MSTPEQLPMEESQRFPEPAGLEVMSDEVRARWESYALNGAKDANPDDVREWTDFKYAADQEGIDTGIKNFKQYAANRVARDVEVRERQEEGLETAPEPVMSPAPKPSDVANVISKRRGGVEHAEVSSDVRIVPGSIQPLSHPKTVRSSEPKHTLEVDKQKLGVPKHKAAATESGTVIQGNFPKTEQEKPVVEKSEISDLVNIDVRGHGHVSGSHNSEGRSRNGQFISKYQLEQIAAHQDQIREGLAERQSTGSEEHEPLGRHRKSAEDESTPIYDELKSEYVGKRRKNDTKDAEVDTSIDDTASSSEHEDGRSAVKGRDSSENGQDYKYDEDDQRELLAILRAQENGNADEVSEEFIPISEAYEEDFVPITDTSPQGRKSRLHKLFSRASDAWYSLGAKATNALHSASEYYSDEQLGKRRKVVSVVAGALALGGMVVLAKYGVGVHHAVEAAPQPTGSNNGNGVNEALGAGTGLAPKSVSPETASTITLAHGGNPWEISRHQLELQGVHNPTNAQIEAYDLKLGKANGYSTWAEWTRKARTLRDGAVLKLPK